MGIRIRSSAWTDVGGRANNEDAFEARDALGLWVVADGMGGYEGGEVASRIAVETMAEVYRRVSEDDDATWPFKLDPRLPMEENLLLIAVRAAHGAITAQKTGRLVSMGSTVAAIAFAAAPERVVIAHVGDSRVYRLRAGALQRLTRDHSFEEEMAVLEASTGRPVDVPVERPWAHMITRALGMKDHAAQPELRVEAPRPGDRYLICSDGLSGTLAETRIASLVGAASPDGTARAVVEAAVAAGARDNVTAVVITLE